ncbi:hypothetical protein K7432_013343 [Basidiobolus ranarum]|uniref:RlpA-like protein double-psi beta-barrel domain-containing protein n=1 Tax=Basidiobolus ranarum TaxID=34480 RepID=A0ABR2WJJ9_9FUNG
MAGFKLFNTVSILVAILSASQVSAAPVQNESGIRLTKRGLFSGDATYYDPGLGACEVVSGPTELIAALNAPQFGLYPRPMNSPACSSCALVQGPRGSVKVKIVDKCPSCKHGDLDLSPAAFDRIADQVQGRVTVTWNYVSCDGGSETPNQDTVIPETEKNDSESNDESNSNNNEQSGNQSADTESPKDQNTAESNKGEANTNTGSNSEVVDKNDKTPTELNPGCDFDRRCVSPGNTGVFETCSHGRTVQQVCAKGTVCQANSGDIICSWA